MARAKAWLAAKTAAKVECGGLCGVKAPGCIKWADDPHHRLPRGRGGKDTKENCLWCCRSCHDFLHRFPAWAEAHGFILSAFAPSEATTHT